MPKTEHSPIPVYILTKTGAGFNDEGIQAVRDLIFSEEGAAAGPAGAVIADSATGILAFTGANLLDKDALSKTLTENPDARVVLSVNSNGDMTLCGYGPDDMGLPGVIRALEQGDGTSWEILMRAAGRAEVIDHA